MKRNIVLSTIFLGLLAVTASLALAETETFVNKHPYVGSINELLGNRSRTDMVGPEVWTGTSTSDRQRPDTGTNPKGNCETPVAQWPETSNGLPALGLGGAWHCGHPTTYRDILALEVSTVSTDGRVPLKFAVVRHRWTPAYQRTYYRSLPTGQPNEYPLAGHLSIKETKAITRDNVFVAEVVVVNDQREPTTCAFTFKTPLETQGKDVFRVDTKVCAGGLGRNPATDQDYRVTTEAVLLAKGDVTPVQPITIPPQGSVTFRYALALNQVGQDDARRKAEATLNDPDVFQKNADAFDRWMGENVPELRVGDLDWLRMYYYRWFVVYRSIHDPAKYIADHPYKRPAMYESPFGGWYGCVIGLPIPHQIHEARWLRTPQPGLNHIRNWCEPCHRQYRGYVQFTGRSIWDFYKCHPQPSLLNEMADAVLEYALRICQIDSLEEPVKLPTTGSSWPTGSEYRGDFFQFTHEQPWDWRCDGGTVTKLKLKHVRLQAIDVAIFAIANLDGAAQLYAQLGNDELAQNLRRRVDEMLALVDERCWDPEKQMFFSVDPASGCRADQAATYASFAPLLEGMLYGKKYFPAMEKIFDQRWFGCDFPVPSTAKNCPFYWSGNCVTGPTEASLTEPMTYSCCWNGPTWYFGNTFVAQSLGAVASTPDGRHFRPRWIEFMRRWNELHYLYGDRTVPMSGEHARPVDGARFSTVPEYFHSAWLDPFLKYWAGIQIANSLQQVTFDPFTAQEFSINGVVVLGKRLNFEQSYDRGGKVKRICDEGGTPLIENRGDNPLVLSITP